MLKRYPFIKKAMENYMRIHYNDKWKRFMKRALKNVDYLSCGVPDKILEEITYVLDLIDIKEGDYLFKAGHSCRNIYIISKGEIDVFVKNNEKEFYIDTLYTGCSIGSYSMLKREDYTIYGRAKTDCTILKLSYEQLLNFRDKFPELEEILAEYEQYLHENGLPY